MRIECDRHGLAVNGVGALGHVPHDRLVRDVNAVEVAHAHDRGSVLRGNFVKLAKDLHGQSAS